MANRIRKLATAGLLMAPAVLAGCEGYHPVLTPIEDAANHYNLSELGMLGLASCESGLDPNANRNNRKSYKSLYQQGIQYWGGRVARYNRLNPNEQVSTDIYNPEATSEVSAEMIASGGLVRNWECESKYHCYSNPYGPHCNKDIWQSALKNSGRMVIGNDIITIPVPNS